jgi:hypothetical protein
MIGSKRLSRYIMSRESVRTTDYLVGLYDILTVKQRAEIKCMLNKNKDETTFRKGMHNR